MYLLASSLWGGLYLAVLFGLCSAAAAGVRYAYLRSVRRQKHAETDRNGRKSENEADRKDKDKSEAPQEKRVYYIVEKKKTRRAPAKYSEPKKIRFD